MWCMGPPGAGKTFLVSRVQNHLTENSAQYRGGNVRIAFLYLNYQTQQSERQLLGCIVRQLVEDQKPLPETVKQQWANYSQVEAVPARKKLIDLLISATEKHPVYIVIDALDECPEAIRKPFMEALRSLNSEVRLMITSRLMGDLQQLFSGFCTTNISANREDILDFVNHSIDQNARLLEFTSRDKSLRSDISSKIQKSSQDMFLLVRLHMESLEAADLLDEVREKLAKLSGSIDKTYDDIIKRIEQQTSSRRDLAIKILGWVAYAARPLVLAELEHALAVSVGSASFTPGRQPRKDDIVGFCCGLIIVEATSNTVRFVHYTAKTYMDKLCEDDKRLSDFHTTIALVCGTYMCFWKLEQPDDPVNCISYATDLYDYADNYKVHQIFDLQCDDGGSQLPGEPRKMLSFGTKLRAYPFAKYAAVYFGEHLRSMEQPGSKIAEDAISLAESMLSKRPKKNFYDRMLFELGAYPPRLQQHRAYGAVEDNENSYETYYCDTDDDIESNDGALPPLDPPSTLATKEAEREITPLHFAAQIGIPRLAQAFLNDTSMVHTKDEHGFTPLTIALHSGHSEVVSILLDAGATLDIKSELGGRILMFAAQSSDGDGKIISDVLDRAMGTRSNTSDAPHCLTDQLILLRLWLITRDYNGRTPLHRAVVRGSVSMVRFLLNHGAYVEALDQGFYTPWILAAGTHCDEVSKILIEHGADVNKAGVDGVHMLYKAAAGGSVDDVKFLLNHNVNPSILTKYGWAPLHWAASNGHQECVCMLVAAKADVNPVSDQFTTPLDMAIKQGNKKIEQFLLAQGAKTATEVLKQKDDGDSQFEWDAEPVDAGRGSGGEEGEEEEEYSDRETGYTSEHKLEAESDTSLRLGSKEEEEEEEEEEKGNYLDLRSGGDPTGDSICQI
ncbi:hypothetical protein VE04_08327 [Pseudogymnoascus sp. 24MN13]|nr:hypothetical protein VE04_08327 [Pseudogymnoascus sp. 24MN13]